MNAETLYNGKRFPEYVFKNGDLTCLFFEFELIFSEEFWSVFKKYLEDIRVDTIMIDNIDPHYSFHKEISVRDLPGSFLLAVNTESLEGYFTSKASLHMITDLSLIYPASRNDLFCFVLQREYELAILGFSNSKSTEIFNELIISDLMDYLTICFQGNDVPNDFKEKFYSNWNMSVQ